MNFKYEFQCESRLLMNLFDISIGDVSDKTHLSPDTIEEILNGDNVGIVDAKNVIEIIEAIESLCKSKRDDFDEWHNDVFRKMRVPENIDMYSEENAKLYRKFVNMRYFNNRKCENFSIGDYIL